MKHTPTPTPPWLFHLADETKGIPRTLADGIAARIFVGDHVMLSVVRIAPHRAGAVHSHAEEQWGVFLEGRCVPIQDGQEVEVEAGAFWHSPGGVPHGIRTGELGALVLDIFSPPREAYKRSGEGFGASSPARG